LRGDELEAVLFLLRECGMGSSSGGSGLRNAPIAPTTIKLFAFDKALVWTAGLPQRTQMARSLVISSAMARRPASVITDQGGRVIVSSRRRSRVCRDWRAWCNVNELLSPRNCASSMPMTSCARKFFLSKALKTASEGMPSPECRDDLVGRVKRSSMAGLKICNAHGGRSLRGAPRNRISFFYLAGKHRATNDFVQPM